MPSTVVDLSYAIKVLKKYQEDKGVRLVHTPKILSLENAIEILKDKHNDKSHDNV